MKNTILLSRILLLLFFFAGCAKMGSLTGGKKDVNPPVLIDSKPLNYSTSFKSQKVEMQFDEYIALKNINQELIISPPLPKKPDVRIKNKLLLIDLKNELRENTTYTLNFGRAITDNNEGNALTNFEFVFSTGDFLDSLSVHGSILSAFNQRPSKEPLIIGLYDQLEDSVPLKTIPVYIGKSDDKGNFQINNIKADTFKLFALKDLNNNLIYDLPNEEIAFIDTSIFLTPEFLRTLPSRIAESDSAQKDTLVTRDTEGSGKRSNRKEKDDVDYAELPDIIQQDSVVTDSIEDNPGLPPLFVDMLYFLQEGNKQYITNKDRLSDECFQLSFNLPLKHDPRINVLNYEEDKNWNLPEINARRDTFTYWIIDTTLLNSDTLILEVAYPLSDSVGSIITGLDTLTFFSRKKVPKTGKVKTDEKIQPVKLTVATLRNKSILDLDKEVPFGFNFPVQSIDTSRLRVFVKVDTFDVLQKYEIVYDSISSRKMILKSKWKEQKKYRIEAFPGAFTDIYNHTNDTLLTSFSLQEKSFYGTLKVTLSDVKTPVVVQLMTEKESVVRTLFTEGDGTLVFEFLPPSRYKLKFVFDLNGNKKWDTGNYLKKIQPEKVMYYKGEVNVRSNWDLEVKESLKQD